MKEHEFISCDNSKIVFLLKGVKKTLTKDYVENKLGIYWFAANLYDLIIKKLL